MPRSLDPKGTAFADGLIRGLLDRGVLDEAGAGRARRAQQQSGDRLDLVLSRLGLAQDGDICKAVSDVLHLPIVDPAVLSGLTVLDPAFPLAFGRARRIIPVEIAPDNVVLAVADPFDAEAIASIGFLYGTEPSILLATAEAIDRAYGALDLAAVAPEGESGAGEAAGTSEDDLRRLRDMASEAPIIRLVHDIITRAVELRSSDIHIEPADDGLRLRYRIDGQLRDIQTLPLTARAAVISRLKIMSNLNIAERRLPQDGRIKANVRGHEIDLRVSTVPTLKGESVVLRILDRSSLPLEFGALGFDLRQLTDLRRLLQQPHGIILVTGPTGSGKTTTLYTALNELNHPSRKIFTVEDPVEYQLAGINQMQVQHKIGLTFASALRSILRQDPDIMMVGEIRDLETAEMAIQSSLTGHLVLSTVHTNSAAATLTRLLQMGVADYLLASTVTGILAQRLVRRLCPHCATADAAPAAAVNVMAERFGLAAQALGQVECRPRRPVGCKTCGNTGFSGRMVISELLVMTDAVNRLILSGAQEKEIEDAAHAAGMTSMFGDGLAKVLRGETVLDEVLRATRAG